MTQAERIAQKHEAERLKLQRVRQFQHLLNQRQDRPPVVLAPSTAGLSGEASGEGNEPVLGAVK